MTTLVSFDVDGTLITSTSKKSNFLHKQAFAHGLRVCFDLDTNVDVIKHHGMTGEAVSAPSRLRTYCDQPVVVTEVLVEADTDHTKLHHVQIP